MCRREVFYKLLGSLSGTLLMVGLLLLIKSVVVPGAVAFCISHLITMAFLVHKLLERKKLEDKLRDVVADYFVPYLLSQVLTLLLSIPWLTGSKIR